MLKPSRQATKRISQDRCQAGLPGVVGINRSQKIVNKQSESNNHLLRSKSNRIQVAKRNKRKERQIQVSATNKLLEVLKPIINKSRWSKRELFEGIEPGWAYKPNLAPTDLILEVFSMKLIWYAEVLYVACLQADGLWKSRVIFLREIRGLGLDPEFLLIPSNQLYFKPFCSKGHGVAAAVVYSR